MTIATLVLAINTLHAYLTAIHIEQQFGRWPIVDSHQMVVFVWSDAAVGRNKPNLFIICECVIIVEDIKYNLHTNTLYRSRLLHRVCNLCLVSVLSTILICVYTYVGMYIYLLCPILNSIVNFYLH